MRSAKSGRDVQRTAVTTPTAKLPTVVNRDRTFVVVEPLHVYPALAACAASQEAQERGPVHEPPDEHGDRGRRDLDPAECAPRTPTMASNTKIATAVDTVACATLKASLHRRMPLTISLAATAAQRHDHRPRSPEDEHRGDDNHLDEAEDTRDDPLSRPRPARYELGRPPAATTRISRAVTPPDGAKRSNVRGEDDDGRRDRCERKRCTTPRHTTADSAGIPGTHLPDPMAGRVSAGPTRSSLAIAVPPTG